MTIGVSILNVCLQHELQPLSLEALGLEVVLHLHENDITVQYHDMIWHDCILEDISHTQMFPSFDNEHAAQRGW